jgi:nucleotide sugar dehydrogenase
MLPDSYQDRDVCIIGLGYVGLTLAVAMADAGFHVTGVERDEKVLNALRHKRAHFTEVGLNAKLEEQIGHGRFQFGNTIPAEGRSTVYIVTVGTPIGPDRRTRFEGMKAVLEAIAAVLRDDDLVVLRSTVRVGTTREVVVPALQATGKKYDLAFCPERTLEGRALMELRTLPQVVGGIDDHSTMRASQLFSFLTPSVVRVRDPETAEMVKLINNTQRDYVFAFANEVAAMCDAIGVSASEVICSGNLGYPRANLPLPGPVGGPCLEKDPYILAEGLERYGFMPHLALAGRRWNENLPTWTIANVAREFRHKSAAPPAKVTILGLAFKGKPETDDLRGTLAIPMIEMLSGEFPNASIYGWDPLVTAEATRSTGAIPAESLEDAFGGANIVLIQNNHDCFAQMHLGRMSELMSRPGIIYDYWTQHDPRRTNLAEGVVYRGLGAANLRPESHSR